MKKLITRLVLSFDQYVFPKVTCAGGQMSQLMLARQQLQFCCSQKPSRDDVLRVHAKLCPEANILLMF